MNRDGPVEPTDPTRHFRLAPDSGWEDVRSQYRRLVQHWHPDRHPPAARAAAQAEFIEITAAFKRLRRHYDEHGRLPPPERWPAEGGRPALAPRPPRPAPATGFPTPTRAPNRRTARLRRILRAPLSAVVAALAIALSLVVLVVALDRRLAAERRDEAHAHEAAESRDVNDRPPPR